MNGNRIGNCCILSHLSQLIRGQPGAFKNKIRFTFNLIGAEDYK